MPKPTMPSREVPVFPSVGGIGGGFIPTGPEPRFNPLAIDETPRPIFSDMSAEQKEQEEKYRAAQAKKPRYFDNVTGKTVTQSEYDALGGNKQPTGGPQTLMQGEQNHRINTERLKMNLWSDKKTWVREVLTPLFLTC
jgi:hypothetical protein